MNERDAASMCISDSDWVEVFNGFVIFVVLALLSLALTWIVKYARAPQALARSAARVQAA